MSSKLGKYIWHNGQFLKWDEANIHIMSHVIHYGSSVFEGIRVYDTFKGPAVYRLHDHIQRLVNSARIYRMAPDLNVDDISIACIETVKKNNFPSNTASAQHSHRDMRSVHPQFRRLFL